MDSRLLSGCETKTGAGMRKKLTRVALTSLMLVSPALRCAALGADQRTTSAHARPQRLLQDIPEPTAALPGRSVDHRISISFCIFVS